MKNNSDLQSGAVRITRIQRARDTRRAFRVSVDGLNVGSVKVGESVVASVPTGMHTLTARIDWLKSSPLEVPVGPGEVLQVHVDCAGFTWKNISVMILLMAIFTPFGRALGGLLGSGLGAAVATLIVSPMALRPRLCVGSGPL